MNPWANSQGLRTWRKRGEWVFGTPSISVTAIRSKGERRWEAMNLGKCGVREKRAYRKVEDKGLGWVFMLQGVCCESRYNDHGYSFWPPNTLTILPMLEKFPQLMNQLPFNELVLPPPPFVEVKSCHSHPSWYPRHRQPRKFWYIWIMYGNQGREKVEKNSLKWRWCKLKELCLTRRVCGRQGKCLHSSLPSTLY
jgi:hypothetical protein